MAYLLRNLILHHLLVIVILSNFELSWLADSLRASFGFGMSLDEAF